MKRQSFNSCTYALGPLRQCLFACLTCNPPPANPDDAYTPAAVCYSCSIACHGEHNLVELFNKRNFVCDCGTTRMPASSICTLREDPNTYKKGVHSQEPAPGNKYNHNFRNRFCGCGEQYDPHKEKGTMFQCLGLGTVETGGCGEDWWHPECLIGLPRDWNKTAEKEHKLENNQEQQTALNAMGGGDAANDDVDEEEETPLPPGFPAEEDFWQLICYKCIDSNPWLKWYAGTPGFLPPVFKIGGLQQTKKEESSNSKKRKADDDKPTEEPSSKCAKDETSAQASQSKLATIEEEPSAKPAQDTSRPATLPPDVKHNVCPLKIPAGSFSLFIQQGDIYDRFCRCSDCYKNLIPHPQLREEEDTYEPPLSDDAGANAPGSTGTGSLLERGEAALSNIDRVRAIEGAMVYNHLRDKVKEFLKPFAESGQAVSAEDIKGYFEKLRGDEQGIKDAAGHASAVGGGNGDGGPDGDNRREQNGMF